jgi:hypothetical protein
MRSAVKWKTGSVAAIVFLAKSGTDPNFLWKQNWGLSPILPKKSPLMKAGLKLLSWRRIVETGVIMLRRHIYV